MGRADHLRLSRAASRWLLLIAWLACAAGCNNTCVSGALNSPSGSTVNIKVSSPAPSCPLSTANGMVRIQIGATPESIAVPAPGFAGPHRTHLFVTLAGLDIHSSAVAGDEAPGWQPLAPGLLMHPLQVDLLAGLLSEGHRNSSAAAFPDAVLPAGMYGQIRLRLAGQPQEESTQEANHCSGASPHCAVMSDGQVWPLVFPSSRRDLRIPFEDLPGRALYVPPDGIVTLGIELDANRSSLWPPVWRSGDSLLFNPVFRASLQLAPEAD